MGRREANLGIQLVAADQAAKAAGEELVAAQQQAAAAEQRAGTLEAELAAAKHAQQESAAAEAQRLRHAEARQASHGAELEARLRASETDKHRLEEQVRGAGEERRPSCSRCHCLLRDAVARRYASPALAL